MTIKLPLDNTNVINIRGLSIDRRKNLVIFDSSIGKFKFNSIMTKLTNKLDVDGNTHCAYCGRELRYDEIVYNLIYPKNLGGIKIPQNMLISCKKCSENKGIMTKFEYLKFLNADKKEKKTIQNKVERSIKFYRKERGYKIPINWLDYVNIQEKKLKKNLLKINEKKLELNKEFFEKYKYFMTPIVINNQDYILDGIEIYKLAQKQKLNIIPVVIIGNLKIL